MLAFQKAVETQADGMELDVHLTRDGEGVVMHDELVDRTTDGTGFVKDYTWAELRRLDASGPFRGKVRPQRVPALKEYLEFIAPTNFKTNIELKTETFDYNGIEEKVWNLVQAFGLEDRVLFSSFHAQSLLRLKEIAPAAPCGLLNKDKLPHAGRVIRDLGFEAYHPLYLRLRPSVIRDLYGQWPRLPYISVGMGRAFGNYQLSGARHSAAPADAGENSIDKPKKCGKIATNLPNAMRKPSRGEGL